MVGTKEPVGGLLKQWRQRRRLSQLDLAGETDISARHLSFLETGRSQPSREMLLRLADHLDIPLRERNVLLVSAGYAPVFSERPLESPDLSAAHKAIELLLAGHEPFPAMAIDRHWNLLAANRTVNVLLSEVNPKVLHPPINVLRLSFHPEGLASRILNMEVWRDHIFNRLRRQIEATSDPIVIELYKELQGYPGVEHPQQSHLKLGAGDIVIPLHLNTPFGVLSFITTTTVFGTPMDVTLSELALETFFPANPQTSEALQKIAALHSGGFDSGSATV